MTENPARLSNDKMEAVRLIRAFLTMLRAAETAMAQQVSRTALHAALARAVTDARKHQSDRGLHVVQLRRLRREQQ